MLFDNTGFTLADDRFLYGRVVVKDIFLTAKAAVIRKRRHVTIAHRLTTKSCCQLDQLTLITLKHSAVNLINSSRPVSGTVYSIV
jgi:hypothetical protein